MILLHDGDGDHGMDVDRHCSLEATERILDRYGNAGFEFVTIPELVVALCMNIFRFIPGYETHIYDAGKEPILFLFLAFMIAFALTRLYTRLARVHGWGSGNVGGVHVHHIVPGIVLMAGAGISAFAPWGDGPIARDILAIFFGIGAALVLDEFALVFHLEGRLLDTGGTKLDRRVLHGRRAGRPLPRRGGAVRGGAKRKRALNGFFVEIALNVVFA